MLQLDASATQMINGLAGRYASLDLVMIWVSSIGVPLLVLAVAAQWWRSENRAHARHVLVAAGLSFVLGLALNQFVLLFIHRMRPYDGGLTHLLVERSADFSFPSDHSTAAFAIAARFSSTACDAQPHTSSPPPCLSPSPASISAFTT